MTCVRGGGVFVLARDLRGIEQLSKLLMPVLFFGLFFAAAFSSSLAGLKVMIAAVAEEFGLRDVTAVLVVPPQKIRTVLGTASRWFE